MHTVFSCHLQVLLYPAVKALLSETALPRLCNKVSAGVSTGIGDHEEKYEGKEDADVGDEQFEINDGRSFASMYEDMEKGGLQPVLNDYIYV